MPTAIIEALRKTNDDRFAAYIRIVLGILFLMTGAMKLLVPALSQAWSGQLIAAGLPFYTLTWWTVPFVEMTVGALLLIGLHVRIAGMVVMGTMVVATYVHLTVDDPSLFPLQPSEPIIPLVVMVMTAYVLWRGAGAWSKDLRASDG